MNIKDFTEPELDFFRQLCNFTQTERALFDMRAQGHTLDEAAEALHISRDTAGKISQKINKKVIRIL